MVKAQFLKTKMIKTPTIKGNAVKSKLKRLNSCNPKQTSNLKQQKSKNKALQAKGTAIGNKLKKRKIQQKAKGKGATWKKPRGGKGVVYLSHIPHGFYEDQIEGYFSQFGKVSAVSVPRSKTGKSKGFAFIEFQHPEVAKIAAETMNNYLMFNRLLKAKYISPENQQPRYFLAAQMARLNHQTAMEKAALRLKHYRKLKNRKLKIGKEAQVVSKLIQKEKKLKKRMEKLGLDVDFEVEKGDYESVFLQKKEIDEKKRNRIKQDPTSQEECVSSEEEREEDELSSLEENEDLSSFEGTDFLSEDTEEDIENIISKAKSTAKLLTKEKKKALEVLSLPKSGNIKITNDIAPKTFVKKTPELKQNINSKNSKNVQVKKLPKVKVKNNNDVKLETGTDVVLQENKFKQRNKNPVKLTPRKGKSSKQSSSFEKKQVSPVVKTTLPKISKNISVLSKSKNIPSRAPSKLEKTPNVVMEVDPNDDEINFKTPPNVSKKFLKSREKSVKNPQSGKKRFSVENSKTISPSPKKSPAPKKPRHRSLNKSSLV